LAIVVAPVNGNAWGAFCGSRALGPGESVAAKLLDIEEVAAE
jgi:hypothetical protein